MKKLIVLVAAFAVLVAPSAIAQKINEPAVQAKLAKSDADVANEKKSAKAATWLTRAKLYGDAIMLPTKNIYRTLDVAMLDAQMGAYNCKGAFGSHKHLDRNSVYHAYGYGNSHEYSRGPLRVGAH